MRNRTPIARLMDVRDWLCLVGEMLLAGVVGLVVFGLIVYGVFVVGERLADVDARIKADRAAFGKVVR